MNEWDKQCGGTDGQVNVYRTMLIDSRCERIQLGENDQFKKVMLASFPGSGNTWARYVIERATGFFTGSVADDGTLLAAGFKGEFEDVDSGRAILVKTHRQIKKCDGAILLVRNPYDAILAEFNRNHGGGHKGHAKKEDFFDEEIWHTIAIKQAERWYGIYFKYIRAITVQVIYFEDLLADIEKPMRTVVNYLDLDIFNFSEV